MARFMVQYHFDRDDNLEEMIEAASVIEAEKMVALKVGLETRENYAEMGVFNIEREGSVYIVPKAGLRYCRIRPTDATGT